MDPTIIALASAFGWLGGKALDAFANVPGGLPTELTGGFLGDFLRGRLEQLKRRSAEASQDANHDLQKALTDSFWLALLYITADYAADFDEPVSLLQSLGAPPSAIRTWNAFRDRRRPLSIAPPVADRELARRVYSYCIQHVQQDGPARDTDVGAIYAEVEKLLPRTVDLTPARRQLLDHAAFQLSRAANGAVPPPLEQKLRANFDEVFRGAFAERIKHNHEVEAIFDSILLSEMHGMLKAVAESVARMHAELGSKLDGIGANQIDPALASHVKALAGLASQTGQDVVKLESRIAEAETNTRAEVQKVLDRIRAFEDRAMPVLEEIRDKVQPTARLGAIPPRPPMTCYGREAELDSLARLLLPADGHATPPVVICSVQGLPGVGKSLLVETFAWRHWHTHFPGGYVSLKLDPQEEPDPQLYLERIAKLLGYANLPTAELPAAVANRLADPRTLLHVENVDADRQASACARLVDEHLPGLAVVISSRIDNLGNKRWKRLPLEPVNPDAALRILAEYGVDIQRAEARTLVARLGYLPLAIRLLGAVIEAGYQTLDALLQRSTFLDISNPDATEEERHRQLRACFAISLQAFQQAVQPESLSPLRDFGFLPLEGAGTSLATAYCGFPGEAEFRAWFAAARRLSLVLQDGLRWRAHPLLADYLRSLPVNDAAEDDGRRLLRMAEWFAERFPAGDGQAARWAEVAEETPALEQFLATVPAEGIPAIERASKDYAFHRGPFRLWIRFYQRGLAETADPEEISNLLWSLSNVALRAGEIGLAEGAAQRKREVDASRGDAGLREVALAWGLIADIRMTRGDLHEALRIRLEEELPVYEKLGDVRSRAVTQGQIADIRMARGDLDEALRIRLEEQLPVYEKLGDVRSRAVTQGKIADIRMARGDLDEALRIRLEEELPVYEKLGDVRSRAVTQGKIADIRMARGDLDEALRIRLEEQLPVYEKLGDVRSRAVTQGQIADIRMARGDLDEALRIRLEEELPVYEKLGDVRSRAVTQGKIADIRMARGDLDEALRIRLEEELPVYEKLGDVYSRAVTQGQIADIRMARGDLDEALRIRLEEELPVYEKLGDVYSRAVTQGLIADIRMARGDLDEALRIRLEEELPVYEKLGDVRSRAVTQGKIADIRMARGDLDEALRIRLEEQLPVYEKLGDVRERAAALNNIGAIYFQQGQIDLALETFEVRVLPLLEQLKAEAHLATVRWNIGVLLLRRNRNPEDLTRAAMLLSLAYRAARRMQLPLADQIQALADRVGIPLDKGDPEPPSNAGGAPA